MHESPLWRVPLSGGRCSHNAAKSVTCRPFRANEDDVPQTFGRSCHNQGPEASAWMGPRERIEAMSFVCFSLEMVKTGLSMETAYPWRHIIHSSSPTEIGDIAILDRGATCLLF